MVSRVKHLKNGETYQALRCSGRIGGKKCDNQTLNVVALKVCVKHILDSIPIDREKVINAVVKGLAHSTDKPDIAVVKRQIEALNVKKRKAVDLMLDGLITSQELTEQKEYYDSRITSLTSLITADNDSSDDEKIRCRIKELLNFTDDFVWQLISRVEYSHGTLTLYINGIESGFMTDFTASGRGENYSIITGGVVRV